MAGRTNIFDLFQVVVRTVIFYKSIVSYYSPANIIEWYVTKEIKFSQLETYMINL